MHASYLDQLRLFSQSSARRRAPKAVVREDAELSFLRQDLFLYSSAETYAWLFQTTRLPETVTVADLSARLRLLFPRRSELLYGPPPSLAAARTHDLDVFRTLAWLWMRCTADGAHLKAAYNVLSDAEIRLMKLVQNIPAQTVAQAAKDHFRLQQTGPDSWSFAPTTGVHRVQSTADLWTLYTAAFDDSRTMVVDGKQLSLPDTTDVHTQSLVAWARHELPKFWTPDSVTPIGAGLPWPRPSTTASLGTPLVSAVALVNDLPTPLVRLTHLPSSATPLAELVHRYAVWTPRKRPEISASKLAPYTATAFAGRPRPGIFDFPDDLWLDLQRASYLAHTQNDAESRFLNECRTQWAAFSIDLDGGAFRTDSQWLDIMKKQSNGVSVFDVILKTVRGYQTLRGGVHDSKVWCAIKTASGRTLQGTCKSSYTLVFPDLVLPLTGMGGRRAAGRMLPLTNHESYYTQEALAIRVRQALEEHFGPSVCGMPWTSIVDGAIYTAGHGQRMLWHDKCERVSHATLTEEKKIEVVPSGRPALPFAALLRDGTLLTECTFDDFVMATRLRRPHTGDGYWAEPGRFVADTVHSCIWSLFLGPRRIRAPAQPVDSTVSLHAQGRKWVLVEDAALSDVTFREQLAANLKELVWKDTPCIPRIRTVSRIAGRTRDELVVHMTGQSCTCLNRPGHVHHSNTTFVVLRPDGCSVQDHHCRNEGRRPVRFPPCPLPVLASVCVV